MAHLPYSLTCWPNPPSLLNTDQWNKPSQPIPFPIRLLLRSMFPSPYPLQLTNGPHWRPTHASPALQWVSEIHSLAKPAQSNLAPYLLILQSLKYPKTLHQYNNPNEWQPVLLTASSNLKPCSTSPLQLSQSRPCLKIPN